MGIRLNRSGSALAVYSGAALALYLLAWLIWLRLIPGAVLCLWTALPLILLYLRHGPGAGRMGTMAALLGAVLIFGAFGAPFAGLLFLYHAAIAATLGESAWFRQQPDHAVGLSAVVAGLALLLVMAFSGFFSGPGLGEQWEALWSTNQQTVLQLYQDMGLNPPDADMMGAVLRSTGQVVERISPAICLVAGLLTAWINLLTARAWIRRGQKQTAPAPGGLLLWRVPERLVWPLIVCGALTALTGGVVFWVGLNGLIVLAAVYFMQGIAILAYWLEKKKASIILRTCVYAVVGLDLFLAVLVALLGLFDLWFDFRRLKADNQAA